MVNTSCDGSVPSSTVGCTKKPSVSSAVPPATTSSEESERAAVSTPESLSNERRSMTAPMKLSKSVTSPTVSEATSARNASFTRPHTERGTYARDAAEHFWPWYSNAPRTSAVRRMSTSADGCASTKSLPPVSPTIRG